jgi:hypothetical protein
VIGDGDGHSTAKRVESKEGGVPKTHGIRDRAIQLNTLLGTVSDASDLLGPLKMASGLIGMALETWKVSGMVYF